MPSIPSGMQYREPFFGNGSFGLNFIKKHSDLSKIWINEIDPGMSCLWTSVIFYDDQLLEYVKRYSPSADSAYKFYRDVSELKYFPKEETEIISLGFKKLVSRKLAGKPDRFSSVPLTSDHRIKGKWNKESMITNIKKISALFSRSPKIEIVDNECCNYDPHSMIEDYSSQAYLFINPPRYTDDYECYFYDKESHAELSELLKNTNHIWTLSYNSCKFIRKLYSWADIQEVTIGNNKNPIMNRQELIITKRQ